MDAILEKLLVDALSKLITPDLVKQAEQSFVDYLRGLASQTPSLLDDAVVDVVAKALGVS